jgi:hypothetical protein
MKKMGFVFFVVFVGGYLASCVSVQDHMLSAEEKTTAEIIGPVDVKFVSIQPLHIKFEQNVSKAAYMRLLQEARRRYQGNIDVVNITAVGNFNALTLLPVPFISGLGITGNFQTIHASGEVIRLSEGTNRKKDTVIYEYPEIRGKNYTVVGTVIVRVEDKPNSVKGTTPLNAALVEEAVKIGGHDIINVRYDTSREGLIIAATAVVIKYTD